MEFEKLYAVPSKGAIMGIMGLQSLNFKRLTFKYGFSLFYLSLLVILYCLSFTWSQGYAAEVSLYSIDNRAFASHVLNAQRRLFSGRLFPHYQVDLTSHVRNAFKPLNPKKKMNGSITLLHLLQLVLVGI